jgi:uncharacterized protein involved in exopolysaccharide biosynthesis
MTSALQVVAVSTIVMAGSFGAYPFLPREFQATADLLIRPTNTEGATSWNQSVSDAIDDNAIQTKTDIIRSEPLQVAVIEQRQLMNDPEFNAALQSPWWRRIVQQIPVLADILPEARNDQRQVVAALLKHLVVRRERKSYLLQVGYASHDPTKSAQLTNALAAAFLADQLGRRRASHQELLDGLAARVRSLEAKYRADESAENNFVVDSGLANIGEKQALQQQLTVLSSAVADAYRQTIETRNRASMLARQPNLDSTSEALNSPLLQHLKEHYVELRSGTGTTNGLTGATNFTLEPLRLGILAETQHIVTAALNDADVAQKLEASLRAELARISTALVDWQNKERIRDELHRPVQTDLTAIAAANERYIQEAVRGDGLQADIEIMSNAGTPDRPAFPNPLLYAAGTVALLVLLDGLVLLPLILRKAQARPQTGRAIRAH